MSLMYQLLKKCPDYVQFCLADDLCELCSLVSDCCFNFIYRTRLPIFTNMLTDVLGKKRECCAQMFYWNHYIKIA